MATFQGRVAPLFFHFGDRRALTPAKGAEEGLNKLGKRFNAKGLKLFVDLWDEVQA
jgi:hypothetical protein